MCSFVLVQPVSIDHLSNSDDGDNEHFKNATIYVTNAPVVIVPRQDEYRNVFRCFCTRYDTRPSSRTVRTALVGRDGCACDVVVKQKSR